MKIDLTKRESHFEFGRNWQSFVSTVTEKEVQEAIRGLERLFPDDELRGKRFLDIGCGSGLSMLAALRLGAQSVTGIDIDENSVAAAQECLTKFAPDESWSLSIGNVLEIDARTIGRFDVVHSWGVLHHTGNLWCAMERASWLVANKGILAIAIYYKTPFCYFWSIEKKIYSRLPAIMQAPVRWIYQTAFLGAKVLLGNNPVKFLKSYGKDRGMSWTHDTHDWLGGYPYESATPEQIQAWVANAKFQMIRENIPTLRGSGIFGTGCAEYVAVKCY